MKTKHKNDCNMVFGRKDPSCPRCIELLKGSPARDSWHKDYYKNLQTPRTKCDCGSSKDFGICTCGT